MFVYFMAIWNILRTLGVFYDPLVHFVFIWYIFSGFGIMCQEKSGNPDRERKWPLMIHRSADTSIGLLRHGANPIAAEVTTTTLSLI
jgi:hypothetical protein